MSNYYAELLGQPGAATGALREQRRIVCDGLRAHWASALGFWVVLICGGRTCSRTPAFSGPPGRRPDAGRHAALSRVVPRVGRPALSPAPDLPIAFHVLLAGNSRPALTVQGAPPVVRPFRSRSLLAAS